MATSFLLGNKGAHAYFGNIVCQWCQQQFCTVQQLATHNCPFCSQCEQLFPTFQEYSQHECPEKKHKPITQNITCSECNTSFTFEQYSAHDCVEAKYSSFEDHTCSNCFNVFTSETALDNHKCPYCPKCSIIFSSYERLSRHDCFEEKDPGEEWQIPSTNKACSKCHLIFTSKRRLANHKCPYCPKCSFVFSTYQKLSKHKCRQKKASCPEDSKDLVCNQCHRSFTSQRRLDNHNCAFCPQCSTLFSAYHSLKTHKCLYSQGYPCVLCNRMFTSEKRFRNHKCSYCKHCCTAFSTFQKYQQHKSKHGLVECKGEKQLDHCQNAEVQVTISVKHNRSASQPSCTLTSEDQEEEMSSNKQGCAFFHGGLHERSQLNIHKQDAFSKADKIGGINSLSESQSLNTMAMITNTPTNQSELQLYRVLEKANLLTYYDSFIQQGGDDVQQLCEASEEEFLEIMALVGMSSKPLHVRRLQKTLQEWVTNPEPFNIPLTSPPQNLAMPFSLGLQAVQPSKPSPQNSMKWTAPSVQDQALLMSMATGNMSQSSSPKPTPSSVGLLDHEENPVLTRQTVESLQEAAETVMANEQPSSSPPPLNRKLVKELQHIFEMAVDNPDRMPEIRKWSAIYGRFDSKRKADKPLTLHEVTVNEAAAQLCTLDPFLLAQREKLFPLARQVVRESGYRYKHGHSRSLKYAPSSLAREDKMDGAKKPKLESAASYRDTEASPNPRTVQAELMKLRREERMNEITALLTTIKQKQSDTKASIAAAKSEDNLQQVYDLQIELEKLTTQQLLLMTEQTDLIKKQRRSDRYYVAKAREKAENEDGGEYPGGSEAGNSDNPEESVGDANSDVGAPSESSQVETPERSTSATLNVETSAPTATTKQPKNKAADPTRLLVQQTLMGEGLRLAQAYGNIEDTTSQDDDRGAENLTDMNAVKDEENGVVSTEVPNGSTEQTSEEATDAIEKDLMDVIGGHEQNGQNQ